MEPKVVVDYRCRVGEGPVWHPTEKRLYWIDILMGRMFWYDPATGEHRQSYQGSIMGGFTVQRDGSLLLFMEKGAVAVLRHGAVEYIIEELPGEGESRFNDVIADPAGRVFCGTMPMDEKRFLAGERLGTLYRLDTDGSVTPLLRGLGLPNGMGFTPDHKGFYFTDSVDRSIYLFDYDQSTGAIANRRVFVETPKDQGSPDGMTVDSEGYVWSARASGSALFRYAPDGREDQVVAFPTAKIVSSVAFGGDDLADMYVTTIGADMRDEAGPDAGALFKLRPGVRGLPEFSSHIGI